MKAKTLLVLSLVVVALGVLAGPAGDAAAQEPLDPAVRGAPAPDPPEPPIDPPLPPGAAPGSHHGGPPAGRVPGGFAHPDPPPAGDPLEDIASLAEQDGRDDATTAGLAAFARTFAAGLREIHALTRELQSLHDEQQDLSRLLADENASAADARPGLPNLQARNRRRDLFTQLHANHSRIEEAESRLLEVAGRAALQGEEIARWTDSLADRVEAGGADRPVSQALSERLRALSEVARRAAEAEGDDGARVFLEGLEDIASRQAGARAQFAPIQVRRLRQELETLRREQRLLRQRLEKNENALTNLEERLDAAGRHPRGGSGRRAFGLRGGMRPGPGGPAPGDFGDEPPAE